MVSFEWSHYRNSSTDSNVRTTSQDPSFTLEVKGFESKATQTIDFVDTETELKWKIDREYTDTTSYAGSMQKNISF